MTHLTSAKSLIKAGEALGLPCAVIPALIERWGPEEAARQFARAAGRLHGSPQAWRSRQPTGQDAHRRRQPEQLAGVQ